MSTGATSDLMSNASDHDRRILRDLARRVADHAANPVMAQRRALWQTHNALRPTRPMISVSPEGAWPELVRDESLRCTDPQLKRWERQLRERLFIAEQVDDDSVVEPTFDVPWRVDRGWLGVEIPRVYGDQRGSYVWDPPIKDLDRDLAKLERREPAVDRPGTRADLARAQDILGDLLTTRIRHAPLWSVGLTQDVAYLVGIEQLMLAMFDQPGAVHRLMAFLQDDMAHYMDFLEREGLLAPNQRANHVGSGGGGYIADLERPEAEDDAPARWDQMWGFCESQETVGISPAMFEEFVLPYQKPLTQRFALNYYGCCEGLEHRFEAVAATVPRLRRVSVAPKADQRALAEQLAGRYVYCRKADPVPVCVDFSEEAIRADIRRTLELAGDQPLELILKDTHTVRNEPWRIGRWAAIAREEVNRYLERSG